MFHSQKSRQDTSRPSSTTPGSLRATGLRKTYGKRTVVHDVSLSVASGEVVGLLGPNGAGKTTSFYMIVGIVPTDSGRIEIDDKAITSMPMHKRARLGLSYLPQDASVFRRLTVEENIRAVLELQQDERGRPLSSARIGENLALATHPRFILLDEPFAGVDPIAVIEIQRIVHFLKNRNIGVLITDHNVRETLGICDRAYIISEGKVLTNGHPSEIIDNEAVRKVYLGKNFKM
jgi:lipopolysaccharide export system ATP-binding protein